MSENNPDLDEPEVDQEVECNLEHLADLDEVARRFLMMFATIRSKTQDLDRARSDIQRFELAIQSDRKRLEKNLETAKLGLKNARVQMGVELEKLDPDGFKRVAQLIKEDQGA